MLWDSFMHCEVNIAFRTALFFVSDVECGEKLELNMEHILNFAMDLERRSTEYIQESG